MSLATRLRAIEREMTAGGREEPTPDEYRVGLRFFRETSYLPNPLDYPLIHDKVANAALLLAYARCTCDVTARAQRPVAPGMKLWHEQLPPALYGKVVIDLIGYPGDKPVELQRNYVASFFAAYGWKGDEKDWEQFGLHGLGTRESPWRAVHGHGGN